MNDTVQEGRTAERILNDPVFQKAVQMANARVIEEWRMSETKEERERYHALLDGPGLVEKQLEILAQRAEWESEDY